jgi:predicted dehydrogenase
MKLLIVGLGSMGKRRARNLSALGFTEIYGADTRADRQKEALEAGCVQSTFSSITAALATHTYDAMVVSLPPAIHHIAIKEAIKHRLPCFIEASVVDTDFDSMIADAKANNVLLAPSYTLYFHPAIQKIKEIIDTNYLGTLTNIIYHSGQYLPDWHTYEKVEEYYVSNPATGGAREIVPFELTWLTQVLGFPTHCAGIYKKTIHIEGAELIDDTYNMLLDYDTFILNLNVDVVSRVGSRRMTINGSEKQLTWDWDHNCIKIASPDSDVLEIIHYETLSAQSGYNKNITEQMYIDEMRQFTNAAAGKGEYKNTMEHDHQVLKVLYAVEESYKTKQFIAL